MSKRASFNLAVAGVLLGVSAGFSTIPGTVWHTDDTGFVDMWNKTDLGTEFFWPHSGNWSVKNPGTADAMITTDGGAKQPAGLTGGWTNLVWAWQSDKDQKNFEIHFSYHMVANPSGNTGFNLHGHCATGTLANNCGGPTAGYRVFGPQIDLGPTYTGDVWNSGSARYATGSEACKLKGTDWQDLEYRISNDTAYMNFYPNGFAAKSKIACSSYHLTQATDVTATTPGLIAIQYETSVKSEFKNIQMRNLDAVQKATSLRHSLATKVLSSSVNGGSAISYSVQDPGDFSLVVRDIAGNMEKSIRGSGPVSNQILTLGKSGIFIVKVASSKGASVQKVFIK